jgi:hypothetical protein
VDQRLRQSYTDEHEEINGTNAYQKCNKGKNGEEYGNMCI